MNTKSMQGSDVKKLTMEKNVGFLCKTVDVSPSILTWHLEAYAKVNYPGRQMFLILWQINKFVHHSERSLMVTLSWVVYIRHTIFLTRTVLFWYIANEVKYLWFDMGYSPPDDSYIKTFIYLFVAKAVKYIVSGCL